ncbi:dTMP kinase [Anaeroselena agilis]|uniref:Thymidylate kinase n=1 Tax=Anaeroselena agilis TaxID=3063788 RepID=A0ABU3P582_9FIRM|nr:dTMP kinase [Selenomonadales bacterium 4137-cl]
MVGVLITFEGPDGGGKTTQLGLLADHLRRRGHTVVCTREPGGTALGDKIRCLLLDPANAAMAPCTEALLYMAARAQHVAEVIAPALGRGEVVLSDRYADSTLVYQGTARRLGREDLDAINLFATGGVTPDLTILLESDDATLDGRVAGRGDADRIEGEAAAFHALVREGFRELAAAEPDRVKAVAADGGVDEVHRAVVEIVEEFFCRRAYG